MLPSISNILNSPDSSTFNHQFDYRHLQPLPKLISHPMYPTPSPYATPIHSSMREQTRLPSPAEILNHPNATVPVHFNRTFTPISRYSGQPTEGRHTMFPVPFDRRCQLGYSKSRAYSDDVTPSLTAFRGSCGGYPTNTGSATPINVGMTLKHIPETTNPIDSRYHISNPFSHPKTGCIAPTAAAIHFQPNAHPHSANTGHDARERTILLRDFKNLPQETQDSKELSRSIHETSLPLSSADGQPSSAGSTNPGSGSSSPNAFSTSQTDQQEGTPTMAPTQVLSRERLFPSTQELELRKLQFLHNAYPETATEVTPKKRIWTNASFSYERGGQERVRSDADSNSGEELQCKRIKIAKTSQSAPKLLSDLAKSSHMVQARLSSGSAQCPSADSKRHSDSSGYRSPVGRQGQVQPQKFLDNSTPDTQENASPVRSESVPTNRHSYPRKVHPSKMLSKSGQTSKQAEPTEVSRNDTEANKTTSSQAPLEVNHTVDQLIRQANMVPNTYRCDECNATFANEDSIARHKRAQHTVATSASQMVKCPECSLLLRNRQNLKRHLTTHGPAAKHKCKECAAKFVTERARTTHMRDVHGRKAEQRSVRDKSTRCPVKGCSYASNQKTNVKRHYENKHLNIKRFRCTFPLCEYVGSTRANRQAHMKTHEKFQKGFMQLRNES